MMTILATVLLIAIVATIGNTSANNDNNSPKSIQKQSVRPTKRYEFKESDGFQQGMQVFQLDRQLNKEYYATDTPNRWVFIDSSGGVKVKEVWDYEQLGKEKTIDFWVYAISFPINDLKRQRIVIHVKDVNDEKPYFINRPLPMQAVVPLNAYPGTPVFKLEARDPDTDHNIHYFLIRDSSNGRFEVDERSGQVHTRSAEPFILDKEYVLYVTAEDQNGPTGDGQFQSTKEERLSIIGGKRRPQFYTSVRYEATIPENQRVGSDIIEIKAKSFAGIDIRYIILSYQGTDSGAFKLDRTTGMVTLAKQLDYEALRQQKYYFMILYALEDLGGYGLGSKQGIALIVNVTDVNDNAPRFQLAKYQAHDIDEDIAIGTSILQVSASDLDTGMNAEIVYSLDRKEFIIDENGIIYSNKRLDADITNTYVLTVKATDRGELPMTGTATVRVYTSNKNDETPQFSQDVYTTNVDANAGPNTLVTRVVATDKDGDNIYFGFIGGRTTSGMFTIEERTGVIRLISGNIDLDKDKYELNVTARDDGSCCKNGSLTTHISTALVVVYITHVNFKPVFEECTRYAPQVEKGAPSGTHVVTVKATDQDNGYNGQLRYSIVQQSNQSETNFLVDEVSGDIKTNKVFDREVDDSRFVIVTVKVVDRGAPPLEGVCSIKVEITDINDNSPIFDRQEYKENVKRDTPVHTNILRVSASDGDAGYNAAITYNLTASNESTDIEYFSINADSGLIVLKKSLDRDQYHLRAIARDKGLPPNNASVEIVFDVVDSANRSPVWDQPIYGPIVIRENVYVGQKVISIKAQSGIPDNPTVFYSLMRGGTEQTNKRDSFYLIQRYDNDMTWADIYVNNRLDYENIQQYNLTVRVQNNGDQQMASEATVYIVLEDVNDEIPEFIEREEASVLEHMPPGTRVTQVQVIDKDGTYPNNKVYYGIQSKDGSDKFFAIDRETGEIYTKTEFDREERQSYAILVRAEDGALFDKPYMKSKETNSETKYIRIRIRDANDNPPYFGQQLYEAEIEEDEDIGHTIITVTATDKDESSKLRYEISQGNQGSVFAVNNQTGDIYLAGHLDYETRKEYELTVVASDTLRETQTKVRISVEDINDLPPKFDQSSYETTIIEEDSVGLPKSILKVTAIDGDRDYPQQIVYFLRGEGIDDDEPTNSKFAINITNGEIYVLRPLDRDLPTGRSQWRLTVSAADDGGNGLVGYADVFVNLKDINDNAPFFPYNTYKGTVTENGTAGMTVMTMTATDYDDPNEALNAKIKYSIKENEVNRKGELIFTIDEKTGVVSTAVCCLDREIIQRDFTIKVVATDGGGRTDIETAFIKIKDINDMPPKFTKKEWLAEVDETEGHDLPRAPILIMDVNDGDLLETNRFSYKVIDNAFGADKFIMVTNSDGTGSLKVAKPLNYSDLQQRFGFNITISVSDNGEESIDTYHVDYAKVSVRLREIKNKKPIFEKPNIEVTVLEDSSEGTLLATFTATDPDKGETSNIWYQIDWRSDQRQQFSIDQNGVVKIKRMLDREQTPRHQLKILAFDDGVPPRLATATLTVVVGDINDNAPRFLKDYRPVITEHSSPGKVEEILATDDDYHFKGNGPPFTFQMDPNAPDIISEYFDVQYDPMGANGDGMAIVWSKKEFDREKQKEYLVPIVIKDSGYPSMTGTSTLTVIIGDINDNRMHSGSKNIFVYNLMGESPATQIGRVYVEDLDDWDLPDKTFFWEGNSAHPLFDLNPNDGMITMKNVSNGEYVLKFIVYDRKHTQEVASNVTVVVREITKEVAYKSASIRVTGITAEDFIGERQVPSMYDQFKDVLTRVLKIEKKNLDVFSVITKQERPPIMDIRFVAHDSPNLDDDIRLNQRVIESEVGLNITLVGIDECLEENIQCEGSCHNFLEINPKPIVVNANRTSLVGVNLRVQPKCIYFGYD